MTGDPLLAPPLSPPSLAAVTPPQPAARFRVVIHLATGEPIELREHGEEAAALAEATELMRYLRDGSGDWPFLAGRFVRPESVVSIELVRNSAT